MKMKKQQYLTYFKRFERRFRLILSLHSFCLMMKHQKMAYLVCRWTWADFQFAVNLGAVIAAGRVAHDARALGQVEHAREQSGG